MKYYVYAVLSAILGGTVGLFVKLIGENVHFMTLSFYRVFLAFLFLLVIVPFFDKKAFVITEKQFGDYFLVGLFLAVSISTFTVANAFAPIHNVSLLSNIAPFFVLILAYLMLKEKITRTKIITLLIAIAGLVIMNPFNLDSNVVGNFLALSNGLFFAFYLVLARRQNKLHGIGDVMWFFLIASLLLLPFPFIFGFGNLSEVFLFVISIGLISTAFQHFFTNLSLRKVETESISIIKVIIGPLVAIALAVFIINEQLSFRVLVGGIVLILAGVYLEIHNKKLKK